MASAHSQIEAVQATYANQFHHLGTPLAFLTGVGLWPGAVGALSILLLLSGLDDLVPVAICVWRILRSALRVSAKTDNPAEALERNIAIFVPCWRESAVIGNMVRHNLAIIKYRNFDFFLGVYPNDEDTVRAAEQLAEDFGNVHVAYCPNPGPTSKADCLNWVYQRMELWEDESGTSFDTVVLHDAEDLIHPEALELINRERARAEMVQIPVLPLKTGFGEVTHGVYCDEFSEFQTIDMRARGWSGSFIPSNGVGTGFAREVLDRLARERNYQVFDPASLTEDYQIGVHIHAMGYRQVFSPLIRTGQDFVATREYFPRSLETAIRQRTRWVTGIALQCWERQGWRGSLATRYWFWRDRKGLIANPLSVLANALFVAGLFDYLASLALHRPWMFEITNPVAIGLCVATTALQCLRLAIRGFCVGRIFGIAAALGVPLRSFHANVINCAASLRALHQYFRARRQRRTLEWQKTDHAYPGKEDLQAHRRGLLDVLVDCGYLSRDHGVGSASEQEDESRLDLLLLGKGLVTEDELCKAMCRQSGLPPARINFSDVNSRVLRTLPARFEKHCGTLPFAVSGGRLLVASARVPSTTAMKEITECVALPVEFQLVTQSTYERLRELV